MKKVVEAKQILKALGLLEQQQNEMSALTLLALANISTRTKWEDAEKRSMSVTKGVMVFVKDVYGKEYAPNTRETFRRQVLHQFYQTGVVDYNPDQPDLPVNSPKAHYALTEEALAVIRAFGTNKFEKMSKEFVANLEKRQALYQNKRNFEKIALKLADGYELSLSPGAHNEVEAAVVNEFAPRFAKGAKLLYLGDTEKKRHNF